MGKGIRLSRTYGFTIVELLIVIVVIAILAAITIVAFNGIQDRARASAAQSSAKQAYAKIHTYAIQNADRYPSTLDAAGLTNTDTTSYQYRVSNSGTTSTFCLTTTTSDKSYFVSNSQSTPQQGACAGHGVNGVAAVTNYSRDPKPANQSGAGFWDGGNTGLAVAVVTSNWSRSGLAVRGTFPSSITSNQGGPTPTLSHYIPYAGQKYTYTISLRLISGSAGIGGVSFDRNVNSGSLTVHTIGGGNISSLVQGQTYKVYITFTADAAAMGAGTNPRLYINVSNKSPGLVIEVADIDLYPGDYEPSRVWASGDSDGWVWNGTPNNSTSTGPAL